MEEKNDTNSQNINNEESTSNKNKKIGFFKKVRYSIFKFEKYPELAAEGIPRAIGYFVKLILILVIVVSIALVYQFRDTIIEGANFIKNDLPDMTYSNGVLEVDSEEVIEIETGNSVVQKVIIDTNVEDEDTITQYVESIALEQTGMVFLKDYVILKINNASSSDYDVYSYQDIIYSVMGQDLESVTKDDIANFLLDDGMNSLYLSFFILMCVYLFVIYLISGLIDTVILAILGNLTILFTKTRLKVSAVYNMAVYSLTLSVLLNAIYTFVNTITGFQIEYFQVMYTSIAYIYLIAAIFMIKSDTIKQQEELAKILEVQEEVREELKEQEESKDEEKEKKDNKENKGEEEKKEKKDKNNKKDDGENNELTGSQA